MSFNIVVHNICFTECLKMYQLSQCVLLSLLECNVHRAITVSYALKLLCKMGKKSQ